MSQFLKALCCAGVLSLSVLPSGCVQSSPQAAVDPKTSTARLPADDAVPRYQHIFVIVAENKSYSQIIGSSDAPVLNQLAKTYGLAANFYGEVHPSEANYVAMLGGSTFGIHDDDAYYCQPQSIDPFCSNAHAADYPNHTIASTSLPEQLQQHGLTWKGYFEDIPAPGSKAVFAPNAHHALYGSKHNGFMNFKALQTDPNLASKTVGLNQLTADLQSGNLPNYSHIILNQCHEMHGSSECGSLQNLIKTGDTEIGNVVHQIMTSASWAGAANDAIVITWDEDSDPALKVQPQGCCGFDPHSRANFGGGHIATIVITNHGPRGVVDRTPYNHYSLLRTTEDAFGIYTYLNEAGNTDQGVKPMTPLFAVAKH